MRRRPAMISGILLLAALAAGPLRAEGDASPAEQPAAAEAPDPGAVAPEPVDPALAKLRPGQCRKLARKIVHYTDVAAQASERGDELWEHSTSAHVDRLEARWNALCANEDDRFVRWFNAALKTAGRLALKYFTMGYFD
ncbi:MAG: hypothetical protein IT386_11945 [Deltaproteobacteria bacterium]|nr:hypothetical protein [Deltaproteobacteria bacterium]